MKRRTATIVATVVMTLTMSVTAFAAGWVQDSTGWWWDNGDGTWPTNEWQWLDGNADGVAECYYFGPDGYMLSNTVTPDGYYVRGDGAWEINSIAQFKLVDVDPAIAEANKVISDNSTATKSADEIIAYLTTYNENYPPDLQKYGTYCWFENANGRVKAGNMLNVVGWTWYQFYTYAGINGIVCALAFDDNGYLMTNTITPDGYQTNEYGQLTINGEVVWHDSNCYVANQVYGLYTDGTHFTDPNTVDVARINSYAETELNNLKHTYLKWGTLAYNHVEYTDSDGWSKKELGYNTCVEALKIRREKLKNQKEPDGFRFIF